VTVGVCTYRRPELLALALRSLARQTVPLADFEVVVVDNDTQGSAQPLVQRFAQENPALAVRYFIEAGRGVSHVRNRCVAQARGEWLAFVDDDEEARPDWLGQLMSAQQRFAADVVLGPVNPLLPGDAPGWLRALGRSTDHPGMATGTVVPPGQGGCGNVLMRVAAVRARGATPFHAHLSLTGGEDAELFNWLRQQGAKVVWCGEAWADEHQPARRLRLGHHLYRNLQFATVHWRGHYARCGALAALLHAAGGAAAGLACLLLGGLLFPLQPTRGAPLMMTGMRGFGRVLALSGVQVPGYGPGHDAS
jgi:succinoglycan biosynthesis protein ExoM